MKNLPEEGTLPPHTLTIEGGKINGVEYNIDGQTQQEMISRLATYVAAHGGTLVGVQFDPSDTTKGFFIVTSGTPVIAQQYTFYINTRTNIVTVNGPFPWQL